MPGAGLGVSASRAALSKEGCCTTGPVGGRGMLCCCMACTEETRRVNSANCFTCAEMTACFRSGLGLGL
eukprot:scaffold123726_cov21-Phaeocystis_antarctica.AAC.1